MPRELFCHRTRYARSFKVPDGCTSEVVRNLPSQAGPFASTSPCSVAVANGIPVSVEDVPDDAIVLSLTFARVLSLPLKHSFETGQGPERKNSTFPVLRFINPEDTIFPIDVCPFQARQFRAYPPSSEIRGFHQAGKVFRQLSENRVQIVLS